MLAVGQGSLLATVEGSVELYVLLCYCVSLRISFCMQCMCYSLGVGCGVAGLGLVCGFWASSVRPGGAL